MNQNVGFHDASIIDYCSDGEALELELEDVQTEDSLTDAVVKFSGIRQITRDGVAIERFEMEGDDGEILDLHLDITPIFLLVEWYRHKTREQTTVTYQIFCDAAETELKATDQTTATEL